ncbi:MAG: hypothetical protein BMS9Abin36_1986 [Gammaproteobacteria bacterium]|nr:MAG: hypothetical protein BMS9Abin36_1986 [Gammaproteobacteria bacterium]
MVKAKDAHSSRRRFFAEAAGGPQELPGANFRVSPAGVRHGDAPSKTGCQYKPVYLNVTRMDSYITVCFLWKRTYILPILLSDGCPYR